MRLKKGLSANRFFYSSFENKEKAYRALRNEEDANIQLQKYNNLLTKLDEDVLTGEAEKRLKIEKLKTKLIENNKEQILDPKLGLSPELSHEEINKRVVKRILDDMISKIENKEPLSNLKEKIARKKSSKQREITSPEKNTPSEQFHCECGSHILNNDKAKNEHYKTKKHKNWRKTQSPTKTEQTQQIKKDFEQRKIGMKLDLSKK
jgi:hypothetical protein